jgi:hypothetical protein
MRVNLSRITPLDDSAKTFEQAEGQIKSLTIAQLQSDDLQGEKLSEAEALKKALAEEQVKTGEFHKATTEAFAGEHPEKEQRPRELLDLKKAVAMK